MYKILSYPMRAAKVRPWPRFDTARPVMARQFRQRTRLSFRDQAQQRQISWLSTCARLASEATHTLGTFGSRRAP
jgi:hypothetical protein